MQITPNENFHTLCQLTLKMFQKGLKFTFFIKKNKKSKFSSNFFHRNHEKAIQGWTNWGAFILLLVDSYLNDNPTLPQSIVVEIR